VCEVLYADYIQWGQVVRVGCCIKFWRLNIRDIGHICILVLLAGNYVS
jgi:hypothetical protein